MIRESDTLDLPQRPKDCPILFRSLAEQHLPNSAQPNTLWETYCASLCEIAPASMVGTVVPLLETLRRLDELARRVDERIDRPSSKISAAKRQNFLQHSEERVLDQAFNRLVDLGLYTGGEKQHFYRVIRDCYVANTTARSSIYSLDGSAYDLRSLAYIHEPIRRFCSIARPRNSGQFMNHMELHLFMLNAIDDFHDLADDLGNLIATPLSNFVLEQLLKSKQRSKSTSNIGDTIVQQLSVLVSAWRSEMIRISNSHSSDSVLGYVLQDSVMTLVGGVNQWNQLGSPNLDDSGYRYVEHASWFVRQITPPILCYGP